MLLFVFVIFSVIEELGAFVIKIFASPSIYDFIGRCKSANKETCYQKCPVTVVGVLHLCITSNCTVDTSGEKFF